MMIFGKKFYDDEALDKEVERRVKEYEMRRQYYRNRFFGIHYYVPIDVGYIKSQIRFTIIMIIVLIIGFLVTFKPQIVDPAESDKRNIMIIYTIAIILLVAIDIVFNCISKSKKSLGKRLIILLAISTIGMITFLGVKANLNSTYTSEKFEEIYVQENENKKSNTKTKLDVGITGAEVKTQKEFYIDECVKAYNVFSIRFYVLIGINIMFEILLIYQIIKVSKIQEKLEQISKDDAILFDEEENIKF